MNWEAQLDYTFNDSWCLLVGGNQREKAREKAMKKQKEVEKQKGSAKGANKGTTLEERRERWGLTSLS